MEFSICNINNSHCKNITVNSLQELHEFCVFADIKCEIDVGFDYTEDQFDNLESEILKQLRKNNKNINVIYTRKVKENEELEKTFFNTHVMLLSNLNNMHMWNDGFDSKLLSDILIFNTYNDPKSAEFLLNPITRAWFDNQTAQKVFEVLLDLNTFTSLLFAERLIESRLWKVKLPW